MTRSTAITLQARPTGEPVDSDFRIEQVELDEPGQDQVLLQTLYLLSTPTCVAG